MSLENIFDKFKSGLRNLVCTGLVCAALVGGARNAGADVTNWKQIRNSDFSSNPGLITNNPSNYYWDENNETYHARNIKGSNEYAYLPVNYSSNLAYKLVFDIKMKRSDWAAYLSLGFTESDMSLWSPSSWQVIYDRVDAGKTADLVYATSDGHQQHHGGAIPIPFSLDTWYHNEAIYIPISHTISLTVTRKSDGSLVGSENFSGVGEFLGIDRLAFTNVNDNYAVGQTAEGEIDNLSVYEEVPEPTTLGLLALGGLGILAKRKKDN